MSRDPGSRRFGPDLRAGRESLVVQLARLAAVVVLASVVTLSACASLVGGPPDDLIGGWDVNEWTVCQSSEGRFHRSIDCVRPSETLDEWTQQLVLQSWKRLSDAPAGESLAADIFEGLFKEACGTLARSVIDRQTEPQGDVDQSLLVEAMASDCSGGSNGYAVARILYARFTIFEIVYVAKTGKEQVPVLRDEWIQALADATVMSGGGP